MTDRKFTNGDRSFTMEGRHFSYEGNGNIADNNFDFDAAMTVSGDFVDDDKDNYCRMIVNALNAPSTAQLEDARHQGYLEGLRDANQSIAAEREARIGESSTPEKRCEYCDGAGDVHSLDGEWRGTCVCAEGLALAGSGIDFYISVWSMRPQPGTPLGDAWERGARWGWQKHEQVAAPTFDRDSAEAWMLRAQVSLKQKQFGAAQMEIENALNILRPKE